jgi:hypothetical protein
LAAVSVIVIGAPPTVLRLNGFFGAKNDSEHPKDEQRKPHGDLLMTPIYNSTVIFCYYARRGKADRDEFCEVAGAIVEVKNNWPTWQ